MSSMYSSDWFWGWENRFYSIGVFLVLKVVGLLLLLLLLLLLFVVVVPCIYLVRFIVIKSRIILLQVNITTYLVAQNIHGPSFTTPIIAYIKGSKWHSRITGEGVPKSRYVISDIQILRVEVKNEKKFCGKRLHVLEPSCHRLPKF